MSEEEIGLIEQSIHMQQSNSSLGNFSIVHVRLSSKSVLRSCFLDLNMNIMQIGDAIASLGLYRICGLITIEDLLTPFLSIIYRL